MDLELPRSASRGSNPFPTHEGGRGNLRVSKNQDDLAIAFAIHHFDSTR